MKAQSLIINWHQDTHSITRLNSPIWSIDFLNSHTFATAAADGKINLWSLSAQNNVTYISSLSSHEAAINIIRFSPNAQKLASAGDDKAVLVWQQESTQKGEKWLPKQRLKSHVSEIYSLAWSSNSRFLFSGSLLSEIVVWDTLTGRAAQRISLSCRFIQGLAVDPLGLIVSAASNDGSLRLLQAAKRKKGAKLPRFKKFRVVDSVKETRLFAKEISNGFFRKVDWSPDGEFLAVTATLVNKTDFSAAIFRRDNFENPHFVLPGFDTLTICAEWSPVFHRKRGGGCDEEKGAERSDGSCAMLAVASACEIVFYSVGLRRCKPFSHVGKLHCAQITDLAWSSDGRRLMCSSLDGYCSVVEIEFCRLGIEVV